MANTTKTPAAKQPTVFVALFHPFGEDHDGTTTVVGATKEAAERELVEALQEGYDATELEEAIEGGFVPRDTTANPGGLYDPWRCELSWYVRVDELPVAQ